MLYTIVLTPSAASASKYIEASQAYENHKPQYLLNLKGTSSPHITVVQFECATIDKAHQVWQGLCKNLQEKHFEFFSPELTGMAFVEGKGAYQGTTWIEISVARSEAMMRLHQSALDVLRTRQIKPLNAVDQMYRPHITLTRITLPEQLPAWPQTLFDNPGLFNLEFGESDHLWQYAHRIVSFTETTEL